jgi:hypothetical protein
MVIAVVLTEICVIKQVRKNPTGDVTQRHLVWYHSAATEFSSSF